MILRINPVIPYPTTMKPAVILVTLLAYASAKSFNLDTSDFNTAYGYLTKYGIPEGERIRKAEEEFLKTQTSRIVGGAPSSLGQFKYQVSIIHVTDLEITSLVPCFGVKYRYIFKIHDRFTLWPLNHDSYGFSYNFCRPLLDQYSNSDLSIKKVVKIMLIFPNMFDEIISLKKNSEGLGLG